MSSNLNYIVIMLPENHDPRKEYVVRKLVIATIVIFLCNLSIPAFAIKRYGDNFCRDPNFSCIRIKGGQSWESLFPDAYERQVVKRLNRLNIPLRSGMRIAIPKRLSETDLLDISPFPNLISAPGKKMVVVDPSVFAWGAYDASGNLVHWGPASAGRDYCSDIKRDCRTVVGRFRFYHKRGAQCKSSKYPVGKGGAPMPYCMFFHGGFAMHASTVVPGYHASHGCVRIFQEDAQWLHEDFIEINGRDSTIVVVNPYM